jgi:WD40 repeat protein
VRETERRLKEHEDSNQRLRKRAVALGATLVLAVGVAFLAVFQWNRASVQKGIAEEKTSEADQAAEKARRQTQETEKNLRIANAERLAALSRSGLLEKNTSLFDRPLAGVILAVEGIRATQDFHEPVVPSAEAALQDSLYYVQGRRVAKDLPKTVAMAVAPDGRLVTAGDDGVARVWDLKDPSAKQSAFHGHDSSIVNLAFAPDGRLVTVGADMTVRVWDFTNRSLAPIEFRGNTKRILTIAFAPSGRLATLGADETVRVWNLESPASPPVIRRTRTLDSDLTQRLTFSADGRFLILADNKSSVNRNSLALRIWSLEKDAEQPNMLIKSGSGGDLAVGPEDWLAAGGDDKTARVWNLKNPTAKPIEFHGHEGGIHRLAFVPDGRLVSASSDKTVRVWDPKNPSAREVILRGHTDEIKTIALAPNGHLLSVGDGTMRLWDLGSPSTPPIVHYLTSDEYINVFAFAKDGRFVAPSEGNSVRVLNLNNPSVESVMLRGNEQSIKDLVVTPDDYLVTRNEGDILKVWNLNRPSAQRQQIVLPDSEVINSIAFTPGGRLVSGGSNGISVRDLNNLTAPPLLRDVVPNSNIFKVIATDSHVVALDLPRVRVCGN